MRKTAHLTVTLGLALALVGAAARAGWDEGVAAFKAGNLDQAANEFQELVDQQPDAYQGHFMLGQVKLKQNKNSEALAHLRKAYELDSSNLGVQMALGNAYLVNGRWADAAGVLGKIDAAKVPEKQRLALYQMRAKAYDKSGDERRARGELKAAADADSDNADLWFAYGAAAYNAGDMTGAIAALERAVKLDSKDAAKQKTYAQALLRKGRTSQGAAKADAYAKAASALKVVVAADPSYDNLIDLAGAQLGAKQYDGALASLEQAAGKNSNDWLAPFYMGQAYTQKSQYRSAEQKLQEALGKAKKNDDKVTIWRQLGFVYEKTKEYSNAKAAYRQAGDGAGVARVEENEKTAQHNRSVEAEAAEIARLQEEQDRLKEELQNLPGSTPPRR